MASDDAYAVPHNHSDTNIYLRGLPAHVDDTELRRLFSPFGEIVSAMVMRDIHTGESLGTAFVRFATHASALAAMKVYYPNPAPPTHRGANKVTNAASSSNAPAQASPASQAEARAQGPIPGLVMQWARKQHDDALVGEARHAARKLFLRNIPQDVDQTMLFELVKPFGLVDQVTLHTDTADLNAQGGPSAGSSSAFTAVSGKSSAGSVNGEVGSAAHTAQNPNDVRLIAFVTFSEDGAAASACDVLHNTTPFPSPGGIPIMAKLAEDTRQRTARRAGGGHHGNNTVTGNVGGPRGASGQRASFSATSTAHGGRIGQYNGFSSYHMQPFVRPQGISTFQEVETSIYPAPMQAVAYSQPQPLSAARTDVYNKSAPMSSNQQYVNGGGGGGGPSYGGNCSADMVVPPRPPIIPLSAHTAQNFYSTPYTTSPSAQIRNAPLAPAAGLGTRPVSVADMDTLSQAPSGTDTASSNSRFRHNPYNALDAHTVLQ